jgi:exopolyphosphatase / guanosine-5'-triphosphate,3'-diphosphate pyrophosphatase
MPPTVPRWEWRTFGTQFGVAEERFGALRPDAVQESDEIYLLTRTPTGNAKIRGGLMDIKLLRESRAGLERWEPVMKAAFPLDAEDAARVFDTLELPAPPLRRQRYAREEFLGDVAGRDGPLQRVDVHKRRVRYTIDGCVSEVTDLVAGDQAIRTIAIESTDQSAVLRAVEAMGLAGYLNANYAVGLRAVLDRRPERYAVIDAGTNSIKFRIAERTPDGWRTLTDRAEITRLGEGLTDGGDITPEAVTRTSDAIAGMVDEATACGVLAIVAVGTAGLRAARNAGKVVNAIRARTGVQIEVIPGDEESRLAYEAVRAGIDVAMGTLVVFDTGGGSSQFTFGDAAGVDERFSVPVGAVRYTEAFGLANAVSPETLDRAVAAIGAALGRLDGRTRPDVVVGMGGAVTNMAAVKHALAPYDADVVRGTVLDRAELDRQIETYRTRDADGRRTIVGLQPKRADVILAGACIVRTVLEKLDVESLTVTDRGLRDGVLVERFGA